MTKTFIPGDDESPVSSSMTSPMKFEQMEGIDFKGGLAEYAGNNLALVAPDGEESLASRIDELLADSAKYEAAFEKHLSVDSAFRGAVAQDDDPCPGANASDEEVLAWMERQEQKAANEGDGELNYEFAEDLLNDAAIFHHLTKHCQGMPLTDLGLAERFIKRYGSRLRYCHAREMWLAYSNGKWHWDAMPIVHACLKETVRKIVQEARALSAEEVKREATFREDLRIAEIKAKITRRPQGTLNHEGRMVGIVDHLSPEEVRKEREKAKKKAEGRIAGILKFAHASEAAGKFKAALDHAKNLPGVRVKVDDFDRQPYLLNCPNGTVDLRTKELLPHRPADLLSKMTSVPYDPLAGCPIWKRRVIHRAFYHSWSLIGYVKRLAGYFATGETREQIMVVMAGEGYNGKGVINETISSVLGDYSTPAPDDLLVESRYGNPTFGVASIVGARFVVDNETKEGACLNSSLIKKLTSGERMKSRDPYEKFFTFEPVFKIVLQTNHRPNVRDDSDGMWRRLHVLHFDVKYMKADEAERQGKPHLAIRPNLKRELEAEHRGILNWIVEGAFDWYESGLQAPDEVLVATEEYRYDENRVAQFVEECCKMAPDLNDSAKHLYGRYTRWCLEKGYAGVLNQTNFGRRLAKLPGVTKDKSSTVIYRGIRAFDY